MTNMPTAPSLPVQCSFIYTVFGKGYLHDLISILHILLPLSSLFLDTISFIGSYSLRRHFLPAVFEAISLCPAFFQYSYHHVSHGVKLDTFIERLRPVPETTDSHLLTQSLLDCCHSTLL